MYSETPLKQAPLGPKSLSVIAGYPLLRGYIDIENLTARHFIRAIILWVWPTVHFMRVIHYVVKCVGTLKVVRFTE